MTDLVERLEAASDPCGATEIGVLWNLCEEAADEITRLRVALAEAAAQEALIKVAFDTEIEKDGVIHSTHARLNLEGAIIDLERLKTADRVIIGTMKRVVRQLGQIESALATPSPRAEALMKIVGAAQKLKFGGYPAHGSGFVTIVTEGNVDDLAEALRAYQEGGNGKS